jgi:hypothetical protein
MRTLFYENVETMNFYQLFREYTLKLLEDYANKHLNKIGIEVKPLFSFKTTKQSIDISGL